jgi:hypothetical protein
MGEVEAVSLADARVVAAETFGGEAGEYLVRYVCTRTVKLPEVRS